MEQAREVAIERTVLFHQIYFIVQHAKYRPHTHAPASARKPIVNPNRKAVRGDKEVVRRLLSICCDYQVAGPNVSPLARIRSGTPRKSSVFTYTVLPHHDWMVSRPMVPLFGY